VKKGDAARMGREGGGIMKRETTLKKLHPEMGN